MMTLKSYDYDHFFFVDDGHFTIQIERNVCVLVYPKKITKF